MKVSGMTDMLVMVPVKSVLGINVNVAVLTAGSVSTSVVVELRPVITSPNVPPNFTCIVPVVILEMVKLT